MVKYLYGKERKGGWVFVIFMFSIRLFLGSGIRGLYWQGNLYGSRLSYKNSGKKRGDDVL